MKDGVFYLVRMDQKRKAVLQSETTIACGVLGFALLLWTPRTGRGILAYVVLLAGLAITVMVLFSRKNRDQRLLASRRPSLRGRALLNLGPSQHPRRGIFSA
jgi:hypothetical protein